MSEKDLDRILDETLDEIRDELPEEAAERAATDAVWARISGELVTAEAPRDERIASHEDLQALIPAYVKGELGRAKALLLEDHVGECLPCRRALKQARTGGVHRKVPAALTPRSAARVWGFRLAAAAAIVVALIGVDLNTGLFTIQAEGLITIERVEGQVLQVTDEGLVPVTDGQQLSFDQVRALRTGKDSGAIFRMADDSVVEMNERAELSIFSKKKFWQRGRGDDVIDLDRGSIIVEASPQGADNLFVETQDSTVAVTGTVFAVNAGVKGSRVSVIEGSVGVSFDRGDENDARLAPGEQATSTPLLGRVAIEDEIAWSSKKLEHLALLAEMTRTMREIEMTLDWPGLRYETTLLELAPADTAVYVAIPNISRQIADGYAMLETKVAENELLSGWWSDEITGTEMESHLEETIGRIEAYGAALGSEIVVAIPYADGRLDEPIVYAELLDASTFTNMLREDLAAQENVGNGLVVIDDESATDVAAADGRSYLWARDGFVATAPDAGRVFAFGNSLATKSSGFAGSSFHDSLRDLYREGAEWIVAADLARLMPDNDANLEALGLADLQHVIGERKQKGERSEHRFVVTFDQPRHGLASWLAEPAPMGSLDFVSGNAYFAASFAMREPAAVLDELFSMAGAESGSFTRGLDEFEQETGLNLRDDFLAALGGEFTVAFDGPIPPVPWKLILEVYDEGRLQSSLERMVELINDEATNEGMQGLAIRATGSDRNRFYQIESLDVGLSVHYAYVDGYLVAASSRQLIQRSLSNRRNGLTLVNSPRFRQALPADAEVNFSAVIYQDLGGVLGPFARTLGAMSRSFSQDQQTILDEFGADSGPTVTLAYGEPERIVFVNSTPGGLLSSTLGSFLRFDTLVGMQELLTQAVGQEAAD